MSLKMFFLSTFGRIKNTSKFETEQEQLKKDYLQFLEVKESDELKSYLELEKLILSEQFISEKKKLQTLAFKGSIEEQQLKEYNKLHKTKKLVNYYLTSGSSDLKRYLAVSESEELAMFEALSSFVNDGDFQSEKIKSKKNVFKGSENEKKLNELKSLNKSKKLKNYWKVEQNPSLKEDDKFLKSTTYLDYQEVEKSKLIEKYEALNEEINSSDFKERSAYLKDKRKFEKTNAFQKYEEFKKLQASGEIKFYHKFPKSSAYRNFLTMGNSAMKNRYEELKTVIETDEFVSRKAYLEDKQKWEKTDEYQKEQLFQEMNKRPHLLNYLNYVDSSAFDFYKQWELVFEDKFDEHKLDHSKWDTVSPWAKNTIGKNFSQVGDLQAYTDGNNIKLDHGNLQIRVEKERTDSLNWKMPVGFTQEQFEYSSGLLSTADQFKAEYGVLEAKIKYAPQKGIVNTFYLGSEEHSSRINLFEAGSVKRVGFINGSSGNQHFESIDGLTANKFYVFKLEWAKDKISWKINDHEVFATSSDIPQGAMHLNLASLVLARPANLPNNFTVDWIRYYSKK